MDKILKFSDFQSVFESAKIIGTREKPSELSINPISRNLKEGARKLLDFFGIGKTGKLSDEDVLATKLIDYAGLYQTAYVIFLKNKSGSYSTLVVMYPLANAASKLSSLGFLSKDHSFVEHVKLSGGNPLIYTQGGSFIVDKKTADTLSAIAMTLTGFGDSGSNSPFSVYVNSFFAISHIGNWIKKSGYQKWKTPQKGKDADIVSEFYPLASSSMKGTENYNLAMVSLGLGVMNMPAISWQMALRIVGKNFKNIAKAKNSSEAIDILKSEVERSGMSKILASSKKGIDISVKIYKDLHKEIGNGINDIKSSINENVGTNDGGIKEKLKRIWERMTEPFVKAYYVFYFTWKLCKWMYKIEKQNKKEEAEKKERMEKKMKNKKNKK